MLAYAIVFFELAILIGVFWYVFIKEPKPYKVEGELWGSYYEPSEEDTTYGAARLKSYLEQEGYSENSCLMCGAHDDGPFNQYAMRSLQSGVRPLDRFEPVANPNVPETNPGAPSKSVQPVMTGQAERVASLFKRFHEALSNLSMKIPS